eukprot:GFYU01005998.1.p2 GENE.GFYU01005998.1~~GFYU01005998.1.p2  ORF type:complete len:110 (+),score=7.27 GFYU01005998.1:249-578(+)
MSFMCFSVHANPHEDVGRLTADECPDTEVRCIPVVIFGFDEEDPFGFCLLRFFSPNISRINEILDKNSFHMTNQPMKRASRTRETAPRTPNMNWKTSAIVLAATQKNYR